MSRKSCWRNKMHKRVRRTRPKFAPAFAPDERTWRELAQFFAANCHKQSAASWGRCWWRSGSNYSGLPHRHEFCIWLRRLGWSTLSQLADH